LFQPFEIRIAIMQSNRGRHAITLMAANGGAFRRYDNDDNARRLHNTFTWVTWDEVMQEWDTVGIAMYALVPGGAPLTHTQLVTAMRSRDERRRRINELIQTGVHDKRERHRILQEEERQRRVSADHRPNQNTAAGNHLPHNTAANLHPQQAVHTTHHNTPRTSTSLR
jgi:hypothetical protein